MVAGGLIGSFVTPILRKDVKCLGLDDCFPLAFGIPTLFMILSVLVFLMGNCYYKKSFIKENMFLKVCCYYWVSLATDIWNFYFLISGIFTVQPEDNFPNQ